MATGQMLDVGALLLSYPRTAQIFNFNFFHSPKSETSCVTNLNLCPVNTCDILLLWSDPRFSWGFWPFHFHSRFDRTKFCQHISYI